MLPDGAVVALCGTLGAGKTRLVQAIAEGCGIDRREVVSPTFVLIQEHYGERTIYHIDAYRIGSLEEFRNLGPEEYFESGGLTLIEWADRVQPCLPEEYLEVCAEVIGDEDRRFEVSAHGDRYRIVLENLGARFAAPGTDPGD